MINLPTVFPLFPFRPVYSVLLLVPFYYGAGWAYTMHSSRHRCAARLHLGVMFIRVEISTLTVRYDHGYTPKMKTAISIPDKIFNSAEALAQRLKVSRSELYTKAVEDYLKRNKNQGVTEILNDVYRENSNSLDDELYSIQTQSIGKDEW